MLKIALKRLLLPATLVIVFSVALLVLKRLGPSLGPEAPAGDVEIALLSMLFLCVAWFLARLAQLAIKHGSALRGYKSPRLYHELTGAVILAVGVVGVIVFASGGSLPGVLATSSVAIAIIGFALRKTIADIFSGVALGLERARLAESAMRIIVPRGQGARRVAARPEDYVLLTEGAFGHTDGSEGTKRILVPGDLLSLPGHDTPWAADSEPVAVTDSAVLVLRGEDVEAALLREAGFRRAMGRFVRAAHHGAGQSRRAPAQEDGLRLPA